MNRFYSKKAMEPIIAVSLLIVVTVIAVVGYQNWYNNYQSQITSGVNVKTSQNAKVNIEFISNDGIVYITNIGTQNISLSKISISGNDCIINQNLTPGVNNFSLIDCFNNDKVSHIFVITDKGIFSKQLFTNDVSIIALSCSLDGITRDHNDNYLFYNSSLVPFGSSCSPPILRTCNNGFFTGDNSYNHSTCSAVGQDITPDIFVFTNQTNVALNSIISSNILIPINYDGPLSIGITGDGSPELSINGGAFVSSSTINPGDNLQIRLTSSNTYLTKRVSNLTIGNYSVLWSVTSGLSTSLSCTTDLDGDGFISFSCAQYPMIVTSLEGHLDTNDNNNTITAVPNCWFKGDKSSCESNFVVNGCGVGTVLDKGTGLCWQRNMVASGTMTWANAIIYCDTLVLAGHSDWYLPSLNEIVTIVDLSRSIPAVVGGNNNKFQNVQTGMYWSKTTDGGNILNAWQVRFHDGYLGPYWLKTLSDRYVVCVRRN